MILRNIDFGNVIGASGVQGFFGEGYWFHKLWHYFGLDFTSMSFVSKTTTLKARDGNMPLKADFTPKEWFPRCVKVKPFRGSVLNSVSLSGPGLRALLKVGKWQKRTKPFWISIMSLAETPEQRLEEFGIVADIIGEAKDSFLAPFGVQVNLSCPNTGDDPARLIGESVDVVEKISPLGVPLMPKYCIATAPIEAVLELNRNPHCDAICVSNAPLFGWEKLHWQNVWGSSTSPLASMGGGGLSGKVLCPLVCEWIARLRDAGFTKPINGGGGILCKNDVAKYHSAGASSVFLGSVAILRPWRVKGIIRKANSLIWKY